MTRRKQVLGGLAVFIVLAAGALGIMLSHESECPAPPAAPAGETMRAVMHRCYGATRTLTVERVAKPVPAADEVLVKVRAAGVNPLDHHIMRGVPYVMRMDVGFGAPRQPGMGRDFSGIVEAVGRNVTTFHVGDEVFGARSGAFAEYVVLPAGGDLVLKPANVSFEQAAGVPIAAVTALQALRDRGQLKPAQKVLINGASGGVGTFAVQIAKALGAQVHGVCSARNVELVKSLGADRVFDYSREDFTRAGVRYDVIIDTPGNRTLREYRGVLTEHGRYVLVGGPKTGEWLGPLGMALRAQAYSPFVSQEFSMMLADINPRDLAFLRDLMAAGKMKTVLDRRYTLEQVGEAIDYIELGHARGKVVLLPQ